MSAASTTAALPNRPDPPQDPAAGTAPAPSRTGRLLGLLRKLVDYGKDLAHTLQQRTAATSPSVVTQYFGTLNIALILARIARGLRLATALETRLVRRPLREAAALARAPSDRPRRTTQPTAQRARLPDVPTAEEIAAAIRHRPAGAVITDICRDLGIVPSHPLWGEVMMVITEFGGSIVKLVKDVLDRLCAWSTDPSATNEDGSAPWSPDAEACGTGPP